jgi:hypothetical protein
MSLKTIYCGLEAIAIYRVKSHLLVISLKTIYCCLEAIAIYRVKSQFGQPFFPQEYL